MRDPQSLKPILSRDQFRLYKLIWERFLASQMAPAVMDTMTVHLLNNGVEFRATGSKVKFKGFMKVYVEGTDDKKKKDENKFLPELTEGMIIEANEITPNQHFTQPPPRYTEARLVRTMEEQGIGRPSTYAPTLDTIQRRGYVQLDNKRFVPTELGEIVTEILKEFFPKIIDVDFTVKMEEDLDSVEEGKAEWVQVLDEFYGDFRNAWKKQKKKWKKWKSGTNLLALRVRTADMKWFIKWEDMVSSWPAPTSRNAGTQSQSSRKLVLPAPAAKKAMLWKGNPKRTGNFMAVTGIRSVNLFHGINLFPGHAQNADHSWWRRKQKESRVQCTNCDYRESEGN